MPCFAVLVAMISPRLAIALLWIFTNRNTIAFESGWVAILGFLFLPWTALAWILCYAPFFGVQGFGWIVVAFAFVVDISTYFKGSTVQRS